MRHLLKLYNSGAVRPIIDALVTLSKTESPEEGLDLLALIKERFPAATDAEQDAAFTVFEALAIRRHFDEGQTIPDVKATYPGIRDAVIDLAVELSKMELARQAKRGTYEE
jgi:hypothetical protein